MLDGEANATSVVGPLDPKQGVPLWLTLSGVWEGTVKVQRSTDDGDTKHDLTAGGEPYAQFTANCCEEVAIESSGKARYYLDIELTSGTVAYELG